MHSPATWWRRCSPAWRGSFKCGPQVIYEDSPPDNGYEKQYETGEIEIRHIRSR